MNNIHAEVDEILRTSNKKAIVSLFLSMQGNYIRATEAEAKLAKAQAEIERLKSEHEDSLRRAKNNAVSLSGTVTEYAGELLAKDKQLAEARAEIERKDKLIEQMRGALTKLIGTLEVMSVMPETLGKCPVLAIDAPELEQARAALAAERSECL